MVRHAQGMHNVESDRSRDPLTSFEFFDARLSPLGLQQVADQRKNVHESGLLDKIEVVIVSPMLRTLQTAVGIFGGEDQPYRLDVTSWEGFVFVCLHLIWSWPILPSPHSNPITTPQCSPPSSKSHFNRRPSSSPDTHSATVNHHQNRTGPTATTAVPPSPDTHSATVSHRQNRTGPTRTTATTSIAAVPPSPDTHSARTTATTSIAVSPDTHSVTTSHRQSRTEPTRTTATASIAAVSPSPNTHSARTTATTSIAPFLPPQIPIPSPLATFKTEPDQPKQQQPLQSPPFLSPPIPIPPPLATVITEPNQPEQQQPQEEPQLLKSINELGLHDAAAVLAFKSKFDELTKHLDFINQAIDSKFNEPLHEEQRPQIEPQPQPYLKSTQTEAETVQKVAETAPPPKPSCGEIQKYCMWMKGKQVRKYIVKNLSNLPKLREEVPAALKLAPEPAKLVLDSVGEMILMGKKAYTNDPSSNQARRAILLLLEFFLSMMSGESRVKISANVKVSAQNRAVALRKRLNKEGGLSNATAGDARGLLLYVACFGIPNAFTNQDLGTLLKLCNLRSISDAIKASPWLPGKMPDIIESMAKNGMHFEALEVVSIFGLEDEFSPKTILTLFLQESTKAFEREKQEAHNSPVELRKVNEKRLGALKSIVHYLDYLEDRRSDAKDLLGSWLIKEKIVKLEEEIPKPYKRIVKKKEQPKRKPDEMGSSSTGKSEEMKRSRFDTQGPALPKSHVNPILAEGEDLVPNSCPVASSAPHPGNGSGSGSGSGSGQMGGSSGVESSGMGVIPASSYSGLRCGWPQHSDMQSASTWFVGLFGSSLSIEGFVGLPDKSVTTLADLYRFADT